MIKTKAECIRVRKNNQWMRRFFNEVRYQSFFIFCPKPHSNFDRKNGILYLRPRRRYKSSIMRKKEK